MTRKTPFLAILVALAAAPLLAFAQPGQHRGGHFEQLDKDHSGSLSLAEFTGGLAAHFEGADKNADGKVTQAELRSAFVERMQHYAAKRDEKRVARTQRLFEKLDDNDDGRLSREEAKGLLKRRFGAIDRDGDGFVTGAEIAKVRSEWFDKARARMLSRRGPARGGFFARLDQDHDGAIDESEIQSSAQAYFEQLDSDHDGAVTRQEFRASLHRKHGARALGMRHGGSHGKGKRPRGTAGQGAAGSEG